MILSCDVSGSFKTALSTKAPTFWLESLNFGMPLAILSWGEFFVFNALVMEFMGLSENFFQRVELS